MPMDLDHNIQKNGPWEPGIEVIAVYTFNGTSPEDLPFQKGDILSIGRATRDPNWYRAKNSTGREGMIPAPYVQPRTAVSLHAMPWFHGNISRLQAEELLLPRINGMFLIRESSNYKGDYTLCVCFEEKVEHYRILNRNGKLTVDEETYFNNLSELVQHYSKDADGLCTKLIQPVQKAGETFATVSVEDFQQGGWEIKLNMMNDQSLWEKIGRGEFGCVYKGVYKGQPVAIKELKEKDRADKDTFLKEALVMTSCHHPNLVQLKGVVLSSQLLLVTEFMAKGNLVEYLRSRGRTVITKKDQINFATDTCAAMEYLEGENLVHRDLAARNVLVNESGTAKVSDFGLAKFQSFSTAGGKFPIKWTSPEALRDNKFTSKSDMWSFGILLWEIYSFGRVPYPRILSIKQILLHSRNVTAILNVAMATGAPPLADVVVHVENGYRMESPEGCPPEVYAIMKHAWEINPDHRPSFKKVFEDLNVLRSVKV